MLMSIGGWNGRAIRQLALKHGVRERQIYEDRTQILKTLRELLAPEDPTVAKVELLAKARALYRVCLTNTHTSTAARLLDFEARVLGAFEPLLVDVALHPVEQMPDLQLAREILNPEAREWARSVITAAGEPLPNTLEVSHGEVETT